MKNLFVLVALAATIISCSKEDEVTKTPGAFNEALAAEIEAVTWYLKGVDEEPVTEVITWAFDGSNINVTNGNDVLSTGSHPYHFEGTAPMDLFINGENYGHIYGDLNEPVLDSLTIDNRHANGYFLDFSNKSNQ
ncbi:hypothetical protein [Ekhidna sp.]|uniref:hypothetical protein n=1 Tax=Ekhidna sp. TaxID=2608089 RepID=UPI0032ED25BC